MNKFIKSIIHFSLRHRYLVFFLTAVLAVIGFVSYRNTPIETFPDVTNTQIIIIAQWPGRSAEEVEKFISIPLETALNSVQKNLTFAVHLPSDCVISVSFLTMMWTMHLRASRY
ncbi:MAG: efflux RND transporter permease subunit [Segetibacter sp.]